MEESISYLLYVFSESILPILSKSKVLTHVRNCLLGRLVCGLVNTFLKAILTPKSCCSEHSDTWYKDQILDNYSHGVAHTSAEVEDNEKDHRKWMNPLETRLPLAPNMKIFCFYGVGKSTERSYFYREDQDPNSSLNVTIDTSLTMGSVDHGVVPGEGDGTVPLLSNGCKGLLLPRRDCFLSCETRCRSRYPICSPYQSFYSNCDLPMGMLTLKRARYVC